MRDFIVSFLTFTIVFLIGFTLGHYESWLTVPFALIAWVVVHHYFQLGVAQGKKEKA